METTSTKGAAPTDQRLYRIGQLARACDISRATLMRFEEDGLLRPAYINEKSGYRYYDSNNLAQVFTILKFQKLGFTKKEIRTMDNPEALANNVKRLHHQHMLILRELEDLTARRDNTAPVQVRSGDTLGGNFFFRKKEILYTPENIRKLAIDTLDDFMGAHISGNSQQTMKLFVDDFNLEDAKATGSFIGQFDGKIHTCTCIIPTMSTRKGKDFRTMEPTTTLTLSCRCDYNISEDLFRQIWNEAKALNMEPLGPVCIAALPDIFFESDLYMSDSTLRLMLRTRGK